MKKNKKFKKALLIGGILINLGLEMSCDLLNNIHQEWNLFMNKLDKKYNLKEEFFKEEQEYLE